jgi:hypothetical protein
MQINQLHFLWMTAAPFASKTSLVTHEVSKVLSEAIVEAPIHALNLLLSEAIIETYDPAGAKLIISC